MVSKIHDLYISPEARKQLRGWGPDDTMSDAEMQHAIKELQKEVDRLKNKPCNHVYEEVGGRNSNYKKYFNGGHAYIKCIKCGQRKQV